MKSPVMLKSHPTTLLFSLLCVLSLSSCLKDEKNCLAGWTNGGISVVIQPVFNGQPVVSTKTFKDTVYVKFGATKFPGYNLTKYEAKFVAPLGDKEILITKLNCGAYYFLVSCQDSASGQKLTGGASFFTDRVSGTFNISIPVNVQ